MKYVKSKKIYESEKADEVFIAENLNEAKRLSVRGNYKIEWPLTDKYAEWLPKEIKDVEAIEYDDGEWGGFEISRNWTDRNPIQNFQDDMLAQTPGNLFYNKTKIGSMSITSYNVTSGDHVVAKMKLRIVKVNNGKKDGFIIFYEFDIDSGFDEYEEGTIALDSWARVMKLLKRCRDTMKSEDGFDKVLSNRAKDSVKLLLGESEVFEDLNESEYYDESDALYEFDLPGFWEIFGAGAAWEAGKAIGALALALLAMGGIGVTVGLLQIKDKISELISERKRVKGAAEGQDFLLKNPKIQELAKISKELWKAQAGKVDKRRKDWEEKLSNLKTIAKDLTKKRQEIAKEIAADIKKAGLSKEAVEYLGTQVSYLRSSYFTKDLMKESLNEGIKSAIQKLFKSAKKKLGMSKITQPTEFQYQHAKDWTAEEFGKGHSVWSIGVDTIQDRIYLEVGDDNSGESEELWIDLPEKLKESVNEGRKTLQIKRKYGMKNLQTFNEFLNESELNEMDNYSKDAHVIANAFMDNFSKRDKVGAEEWEQFIYDFTVVNNQGPELEDEEIDKYTMDDVLNILGDNRYNKVDMDAIGDLYEGRKTLQIKRKYTEKYPSKSVGKWAPIREAILRHVKENGGTISKEDLMEFIKGMNEEKGTRTSWDWVRRNSRYLKETKNGYKITSIGERVLKATSLNESLLLTEGQFSWLTHDTSKQIGSERANTIFVTMFDDKGNKWEEKGYDGYGEFGGKDYYILLAEMNGVTDDNAEELITKHKITVFGKGTLDDMKRQLGIDLAFENTKKLAVDIAKITGTTKIKYPALYEYPRKFNKNAHDFHREADNDPNQSWYVEDEYDDEDYY